MGGRLQAFPKGNWRDEFFIASELGLDCMEWIFEEVEGGNPILKSEGILDIQELQKETGVVVLSLCADYFMESPLHWENTAKQSVEVLQDLLSQCAKVSIKDVVIPCVDKARLQSEDQQKLFVAGLRKCLPLAQKYGINLSLETDLPPRNFLRLLQEVGHFRVKVNYDIGNSASLGYDPGEELGMYGSYISDVHIKDRREGGGSVPLGEGSADFSSVFQILRELKFSGPYILQAARKEKGEERETIAEYLSFLKPFGIGGKNVENP